MTLMRQSRPACRLKPTVALMCSTHSYLEIHYAAHQPMSRESTPTSLLGGLAITGSPASSVDMPVTTRGMQNRRQRNLAASHHASSGAAAGSSRVPAASSSRQTAGRSTGTPTNRARGQRRYPVEPRRTENDSDDGDDSSDDGDSDNEDVGEVVNEIMATFADTYPTPQEFTRISLHNTRNVSSTEQTRDCRRLAEVLTDIVSRDPEGLTSLRTAFSRQYCAARLVSNMWQRNAAIMRNLQVNLQDQTKGRDVPDSLLDWRRLNLAIESTLAQYWNDLSDGHRQSLASLLISILNGIFQTDRDLYDGTNRTIYAGESSGGNLFRRFLSPRAEPIAFLEPLRNLDANLLASCTDSLSAVITKFTQNGETGSDREQYRLITQALAGIWTRATGQQL